MPFCLESIFRQTFRDFSLLILDNGSTDGTVEYLKDFRFPISDFRLVFNDKNVGFAAGHNQAIRMTNSEYVFMLNQDIILEQNFLEVIIKFFDEHPSVGAVTGKLLRWDFEKEIKTDMIDSAGLLIFKSHRIVELGAGEQDGDKWNNSKEVFGVSGAAPVYRREALEDVAISIPRNSALCSALFSGARQKQKTEPLTNKREYFDEDFFSYKEDVDLAYRLCMRGWQAWFLPEARAYHDRTARATAGGDLGAMCQRKNKSSFINYHSYKNHLFFLTKNLTWPIFLRYFPHIFWYEFKKFIYILFFEVSTLKSLGEFFRKLPKMWRKRRWIIANRKVSSIEIKKWPC